MFIFPCDVLSILVSSWINYCTALLLARSAARCGLTGHKLNIAVRKESYNSQYKASAISYNSHTRPGGTRKVFSMHAKSQQRRQRKTAQQNNLKPHQRPKSPHSHCFNHIFESPVLTAVLCSILTAFRWGRCRLLSKEPKRDSPAISSLKLRIIRQEAHRREEVRGLPPCW